MDTNDLIRVLIADDHEIVREGLVALLNNPQMQVVAVACNGLEAIELYRQFQPDITLMDLRMPSMDGLTATRIILNEFPLARIIILTISEGTQDNSRRAGARAIILKDAPIGELTETICAVHALAA